MHEMTLKLTYEVDEAVIEDGPRTKSTLTIKYKVAGKERTVAKYAHGEGLLDINQLDMFDESDIEDFITQDIVSVL